MIDYLTGQSKYCENLYEVYVGRILNLGAGSSGSVIFYTLDASRNVLTGKDVAGTNLSCRYWRRVPEAA